MGLPVLDESQVETIANIIGDTNDGLSGSQIHDMLTICKIPDIEPSITKRKRVYFNFVKINIGI